MSKLKPKKPKKHRDIALWRAKATCGIGISELEKVDNPEPIVKGLYYILRVLEDVIMVIGDEKID